MKLHHFSIQAIAVCLIVLSLSACEKNATGTTISPITHQEIDLKGVPAARTESTRTLGNDEYTTIKVQANLSDLTYTDISPAEFIDHYFKLSSQISSTQFMLSEPQTFTIPENTVSFSLNFHSQLAGGDVFLAEIINPEGESLYMPDLTPCFDNTCSMVIPNRPNDLFQPKAGEWQYRVAAQKTAVELNLFNSTLVNMLLRVELDGEDPGKTGHIQGTLPIQAWYTGNNVSKDHITKVMNELIELFYGNGIGIDWKPPTHIANQSLASVPPIFSAPKTTKLLKYGAADVINVYFVEAFDQVSSQTGKEEAPQSHPGMSHDLAFLLGIAAGIPGSLGTEGPANGVLVGLGYPTEDNYLVRDAEETAKIAAHEIGHFLGLYHTTEASGAVDVLDDTPFCMSEEDKAPTNDEISITAENCPDGFNLMFPFVREDGLPAIILTDDQRFVIVNSPLAQ